MYIIHDGNTIVYETLEELLKENIAWISEYEGFYYVKLVKEYEDDSVWKVDKKTGKASYMQFPLYLVTIQDKAKNIDPAMLRTLKKGA